jgi:CubicO group peptidase (beta-lactamase class C family)
MLMLPLLLPLLVRPAVAECDMGATFPAAEWTRAPAPPPGHAVGALEAYAFPPVLGDKERAGVRTHGVVIVRGGQVIYEHYDRGADASKRHLAWSVSKSVTGALAGVAVQRGRLRLDQSVCEAVPTMPPTACAVQVQHLLAMNSGFDWAETYEGEPPTASSVLAMLYGEGQSDMAAFVAAHPLRDPPGTSWMYSSGDSVVLTSVVRAALEPVSGARWAWANLFDPLGMTSASFEVDGVGTPVGSSTFYATPLDMARFGWFMAQDGCWGGHRLLPEGWMAQAASPNVGLRAKPLGRDDGDVYGWQLWLNAIVPEVGQAALPWPSLPADAYAARGHWGQSILVVPSLDVVIVRTADDRDGSFSLDQFGALALAVAGVSP